MEWQGPPRAGLGEARGIVCAELRVPVVPPGGAW